MEARFWFCACSSSLRTLWIAKHSAFGFVRVALRAQDPFRGTDTAAMGPKHVKKSPKKKAKTTAKAKATAQEELERKLELARQRAAPVEVSEGEELWSAAPLTDGRTAGEAAATDGAAPSEEQRRVDKPAGETWPAEPEETPEGAAALQTSRKRAARARELQEDSALRETDQSLAPATRRRFQRAVLDANCEHSPELQAVREYARQVKKMPSGSGKEKMWRDLVRTFDAGGAAAAVAKFKLRESLETEKAASSKDRAVPWAIFVGQCGGNVALAKAPGSKAWLSQASAMQLFIYAYISI